MTYDNFGRITSLPAEYAGDGNALSTSYFNNDMAATQSQGAITITFELDATGRQRQRLQGGGLEGVEVFHYAGARTLRPGSYVARCGPQHHRDRRRRGDG